MKRGRKLVEDLNKVMDMAFSIKKKKKTYLFVWLCWVLIEAYRI